MDRLKHHLLGTYPVTDRELIRILDIFQRFPNSGSRLPAVFANWIIRADGFVEAMTLDNRDSSIVYLINKLEQLLMYLPQTATGADIIDLAAKDFEILFFRAQFGSVFWNSTAESFRSFCLKHNNLPNQLIIDTPHEDQEHTAAWLHTLAD